MLSALMRRVFWVVSFTLLPYMTASAAAVAQQCSLITDQLKSFVFIGMDDISVPIHVNFTPEGMCYHADFNGDGRLDVLVQGHTPDDQSYLFLADNTGAFNSVSQSWRNDYLGLDWSSNNSDLFIDDYNADGRADIIVDSGLNGGTSAILYADGDGKFSVLEYAWENVNTVVNKPVVAGTLPGSFDVTPGGAAIYSIPIEVPPGIAGMQPTISLDYNSQGGNGLLGVGWSVGGLSAITRCPRTIAQDGVRGGIKLDANDRFCLNGQRLVAVSGAYGANGTQYRTEIDSFARVTSFGAQGNGPQYFTVQTKAGQTMYYGNTEDARVNQTGNPAGTVLSWAMNRIEDTVGNYIDFIYFEDNATGEHYIDRIEYTGNGAQLPSRAVEFVYDASGRSDKNVIYMAGSAIRMNARLSNVRTYVFDDMVLDYQLTYETGLATRLSRVKNIQMCGTSECFASKEFSWQDGDVSLGGSITNTTSFHEGSVLHPGDYNGDGITDMLFWNKNSGTIYVHPIENGVVKNHTQHVTSFHEGSDLYPGDYNGDGVTDVFFWNKGQGTLSLTAMESEARAVSPR